MNTEAPRAAGMWNIPRDARRGAIQLARRQGWPDLPFIHGEILDRMIERSEIMRPADGCVLDVSLGREDAALRLAQRFNDRPVHLVRWRNPLPAAATGSWLQQGLARLRGHASRIRLAGSCVLQDEASPLEALPPVGLVWSNGLLHRVADPARLLQAWRQSLVTGGALFFSCFGPDTARELREAATGAGLQFPDFADMHDWGDLLVRSGFSDPVMEMERLVLTYRNAESLLRDWHALGGNCGLAQRSGLHGRQWMEALHKGLQNACGGDLQITFEILYGHAWRVERPARPQEVSIPVSQIRRKP